MWFHRPDSAPNSWGADCGRLAVLKMVPNLRLRRAIPEAPIAGAGGRFLGVETSAFGTEFRGRRLRTLDSLTGGGAGRYLDSYSSSVHFPQVNDGCFIVGTCDNRGMSDFGNLTVSSSGGSGWDDVAQNSRADDEALAAAIHLDERIAQYNTGSGGVYGKILNENLKFARGVVVDSNALYCEVSNGNGSPDGGETPAWAWLHYFCVRFIDIRDRQVNVWTGDVSYTGRNLPIGSSVVVQYADQEQVEDIRIRRIFTYLDFNVSMSGSVKTVPGGSRVHHVSGSDDYQDPGSFGSLWRRAAWGARYAMSGMDGYEVFDGAAQPQDVEGKETVQKSMHGERAIMTMMVIVGFGFVLSLAAAQVQRMQAPMPHLDTSFPFAWIAALLALVLVLSAPVVYLRYGHARNATEAMHRRWWRTREKAEVQEVVTVPLFTVDAFCGYGYVARLETRTGSSVWAMGDPEAYESYLPQGGKPPVAAGDEAILVRTSGKRTYVHRFTGDEWNERFLQA